jgi:hypothetical protein
MKKLMVLFITLVFLAIGGTAGAFEFSLYETIDNTPTGTPTETGPVLELPQFVTSGYLVLLEHGIDQSQSNWSDVVVFTASTVQLLSDVKEGLNPYWPTLDQVLGTEHAFIQEIAPPTIYNVGNVYYIYSDAPEPVPEPATMLLLGSGLIGLVGYGRKKFKKLI